MSSLSHISHSPIRGGLNNISSQIDLLTQFQNSILLNPKWSLGPLSKIETKGTRWLTVNENSKISTKLFRMVLHNQYLYCCFYDTDMNISAHDRHQNDHLG